MKRLKKSRWGEEPATAAVKVVDAKSKVVPGKTESQNKCVLCCQLTTPKRAPMVCLSWRTRVSVVAGNAGVRDVVVHAISRRGGRRRELQGGNVISRYSRFAAMCGHAVETYRPRGAVGDYAHIRHPVSCEWGPMFGSAR